MKPARELLALLTPLSIGMITSVGWGSYDRELPEEKELTDKIFTKRSERNNMTFRTRIKRLVRKRSDSLSSAESHETVNEAFIEK